MSKRKPVIDPKAVKDFEEKIAQELLRFCPGPGGPDEIDRRDAAFLAPLLKSYDWPMIKRFGAWLFSDAGWPKNKDSTPFEARKRGMGPGPSNADVGQLRVKLKAMGDPDA